MNGHVDSTDRALLVLRVRASERSAVRDLTVWIDTAFTGELVIPRSIIETLQLHQSAAVMAGLADGTLVVLDAYTCILDWFGEQRAIEAIANEGQFPLLGVGLLRDRRLEIDYLARTVVLQ